jgi:hypothetical protein
MLKNSLVLSLFKKISLEPLAKCSVVKFWFYFGFSLYIRGYSLFSRTSFLEDLKR